MARSRLTMLGGGQPARQVNGAAHARIGEVQQYAHRLADGCRVAAGHVGVEQRAGHDAQRQMHHLLGHVDRLAGGPAVDLLLGVTDHHVGVAGNALHVEGGLRGPGAAAARNSPSLISRPLPSTSPGAFQGAPRLVEGIGLLDEHPADKYQDH